MPRDSEEVRRFLGHVNYMAKFMPNLSAESEPLRRLLKIVDKDFCWGVDQSTAYETLKRLLTSEQLLQYYDNRKPIVIQTDASTAGLGAVLMQQDKPVAYISRVLSKSETNYAPIELECLAIVFATNRFDQYIWPLGCDNTYRSSTTGDDNDKITTEYSKADTVNDAGILQQYALNVKWKPGKEQVTADWLARGGCWRGGGAVYPLL